MSSRPFLFGGSSGNQSQNKYLVEFRAGKMTVKGKMVQPDKRKGLVYLHQSDESLMHFCWKDRTTGAVEDELIIFPDDAEFKRVPQCTTGRVFVLKFKSSNRRCFYWMQEPKTDKDEEFCTKVNEFLNNPPVPGSGLGSSGSSSGGLGSLQSDLSNLADGDLQNLLNNISQQQLAQFLGTGGAANLSSLLSRASSMQSSSVASSTNATATATPTPPTRSGSEASTERPSTTATPTPTPQSPTPAAATTPSVPSSSAGAQIQLSDVQSILSNLNEAGGSSVAEALAPLLGNPELMERIQKLLPSSRELPKSSTPVPEQLKTTVQSPQFQQSLSIFSQALQSGQLGPLMAQFGLSPEVVSAANSGDMEAFVRALQASQAKSGDDKKGGKDEEMSRT